MLQGTWKRLALIILGVLFVSGAALANPVAPSTPSTNSRALQMAKRMIKQLMLKPTTSRGLQQANQVVRKKIALDLLKDKNAAPKQ